MILIYLVIFVLVCYGFIFSLIRVIKEDESHHQYTLHKHLTVLYFIVWSALIMFVN
ncbi:hypothetical protein [Pontibacillus chungwhensis]|uniref:Uncharacterized protein n=1 Tax=Pontibacillus chungwhensis TaxID=265426 RepID=A0ABY8UY50_9BACI|nr:hypothetical protein [Pontibacillus chungwhensis]WIF96581.1 hypothetical protein QNI29_12550 [Pontibacillus chungwhensis]